MSLRMKRLCNLRNRHQETQFLLNHRHKLKRATTKVKSPVLLPGPRMHAHHQEKMVRLCGLDPQGHGNCQSSL